MLAGELALMRLPLSTEEVEVSLLDLTRVADEPALASRFLTPPERAEYAQLSHPSRRREWLGARVCLKAMLLRRGRVEDPLQCAITKDASGRPRLSFATGAHVGADYACSLSHKGRFAGACAATAPGASVGVDIEEVSPRLLRLAGVLASDRDSLPGARAPEERLALLWALREACAKAVGGGIGVAMGNMSCEETTEGHCRVTTGDGLQFRARHVLHDGYVVAVCFGRADDHTRKGIRECQRC